jgi:ribosome recycling factor
MEKNSEITEDDLRYYEDKIQELTDDHTDMIDATYEEKKEEIMKI